MNLRSVSGAALAVLACSILALPSANSQEESPLRIAIVDLEAVVANSAAGRLLQEELEEFQASAQEGATRRQESARQLRQRIADGTNALSAEQLAELQRQLDDALIDFRRYAEEQQRAGEQLRNRRLAELERQLQPVFEQIQAESAYDVIFNKSSGIVVMAGERVDITNEVVRRFDAETAGR